MAILVTAAFFNAALIHICAMPQASIKKRMVKIKKKIKKIKHMTFTEQMHVNKRLLNCGVYPKARSSNED